MNHYEAINDVLVNLFNEILDLEERALITPEYKNISVNDMHIMDAVGIREQKNMSTVARALNVTVGTLTIAVNNLVKKGYIQRVRSEEDRRVVLISLTEKGEKAFCHHRDFHEKMVLAILKDLNVDQMDDLRAAADEACDCLLHQGRAVSAVQVKVKDGGDTLTVSLEAEFFGPRDAGCQVQTDVSRAVLETLIPQVTLHCAEDGCVCRIDLTLVKAA